MKTSVVSTMKGHWANGTLKVGFSGSSKRLTSSQKTYIEHYLTNIIKNASVTPEFHHGDCIVADEFAHNVALRLGYRIVIHPPKNPKKRAFCKGYDYIHPKKSYLDRNIAIVLAVDVLLAAPDGPERQRSGTWSTVRNARKYGKPVDFAKGLSKW